MILSANCTMMLTSGEYKVRKLIVNPDAKLMVVGKVTINIGEQFSFGDRSQTSVYGKISDFVVYAHQTSDVYVGVGSEFRGVIEAPRAKVNVAPFSNYSGCIHANQVRVEADATLTGENLRPVVLKAKECEINVDCEAGELCTLNECIPAPLSPIAATIAVNANWDTGYCADVAVKNIGTVSVSTWRVVMDAHQSTVTNLWSGAVIQSGSTYTVTPLSWNGNIQPGGTQSFGFCANKTGADYIPTVIETSGQ